MTQVLRQGLVQLDHHTRIMSLWIGGVTPGFARCNIRVASRHGVRAQTPSAALDPAAERKHAAADTR